jgi:hypothetical protein
MKQAPTYRIGKVTLIPSQIQDPNLREEDKKITILDILGLE